MKLVPVKQAQAKILNAMADRSVSVLTLATFKKDRFLTLRRVGDDWQLEEQGYTNAAMPLSPNAAGKRLIKEAFKREFPRSSKLYLTETKTSAS